MTVAGADTVQINAATKVASLLPVPETAPLLAAAAWPVRSGAVPPLADRFSPRTETAPDLKLALQGGSAIALSPRLGLREPGLDHDWLRCGGKTQLAVAYAESLWRDRAIDLLVWIDGSSTASILSGYAAAANAVTEAPTPGGAESVAASFLSWLGKTDRRWLLVLDDVPDSSVLHGWWPAGPTGQVIVTTQRDEPMARLQDVAMLEIGPFSRREAMSYLVGRLSDHPDQRRGVIDLVDDLDCQPLALAQATAVIASSWMTSVDYREQFRRRSAALGSPGAEPLPAASVTWTLSLETADQLMPGGSAEPCLALAAMLDGHGIPATVFTAPAACSYVAGGVAAPGALERVQETLAVLDEVVLISLDRRSEPPIVRMNQALGRAVRAGLPPEKRDQAARAAAAALLESWPSPEPDPSFAQSLRSSAVALRRATGALLLAEGSHPLLLRAGQSLAEASLTGPAVDYWTELASVANGIFGPGHPESIASIDRLAGAFVEAGRLSEAVACYQRAVADCEAAHGPYHSGTLTVRVRLGSLLAKVRQLEEANVVLSAAMADSDRAYGPGHHERASIRCEAAAGYQAAAADRGSQTVPARPQRSGTLTRRATSGHDGDEAAAGRCLPGGWPDQGSVHAVPAADRGP